MYTGGGTGTWLGCVSWLCSLGLENRPLLVSVLSLCYKEAVVPAVALGPSYRMAVVRTGQIQAWVSKHSINSTFGFRQVPSARHSLSFQRQSSVLALNGRPSEDGNSGLCKLYKDFLSPSNSTEAVQNQQSPHQCVRLCDSAPAPGFLQGNLETFGDLIKSPSPQPPFSLGIFMWKNIKFKIPAWKLCQP